jgi:hypothetical protein
MNTFWMCMFIYLHTPSGKGFNTLK